MRVLNAGSVYTDVGDRVLSVLENFMRRRAPVIALVLFAWTVSTARAQIAADPQPTRATLAVVGGVLIDGHEGPPVPNSVVLIDGKRIVAVGTRDSLKVPPETKVIDAAGHYVLPGLIDRHVHLDLLGYGGVGDRGGYGYWHKTYGPQYELVAETSARQLLFQGVTTAVDLGGDPAIQLKLRDRISRGDIPGPRLLVSIGWITNWSDEQFASHHRGKAGAGPSGVQVFNVRSVEDAQQAIQKTVEMGADIVKLYTGLTAEQMKPISEGARKKGLRITGHVSGRDDTLMRIRSGQHAIEHQGFDAADGEVVKELVARRTVVVPTNVQSLAANLAIEEPIWLDDPRFRLLTPPALYAAVRDSLTHINRVAYFGGSLRPRRIEESLADVKRLYDAGVALGVGTDSGTPANYHTASTWRQMELLVRAGIPAMEVIGMATRSNAQGLGLGSETGTIDLGKMADLIVVDGNPLRNMNALQHVVYVVKEGVQYKGSQAAAPGKTTQ
jgi:imidazolonepropionase-like amidohydrolase